MTGVSTSNSTQKKAAVQKPSTESDESEDDDDDDDDAGSRNKAKSAPVDRRSAGKVPIFYYSRH